MKPSHHTQKTNSPVGRGPRKTLVASVLAALLGSGPIYAFSLAEFGLTDNPTLAEQEDVYDLVFTETWETGKPSAAGISRIDKRYFATPPAKVVKETPPQGPSRIHPVLLRWLSEKSPDELVEVIVSRPENLLIPRFPEPDVDSARSSTVNQTALARAKELVARLTAARADANRIMSADITKLGGKVTGTYWLVPTIKTIIPIASVRALLSHPAVNYIEPAVSGEKPPANANPNDDVDDARALLQSDPYFNVGLTSGWIGLLDSGVLKC